VNIYLVRHTRVAVAPNTCYGASDVSLADTCNEDISGVTRQLVHLNDPVVYSSPLSRCRLLAEKISPQVVFDDRLKELNFGEWEMQPWDSITGPEANRWMNDYVNARCPGGESYIDLSVRVQSFLSDVSDKNHETAIIVTHGGVIRTILAFIQDIPLIKSFDIKVQFGQIIRYGQFNNLYYF
jgi:alpha-ribazole phosphatase